MGHCTMPHALGFRRWFEERFGDLCAAHDAAYAAKETTRREADLVLASGIFRRGYPVLAIASFLFVRLLAGSKWG